MAKILKILKDGTTNLTTFKTTDELYKICGFRKIENFHLLKTHKKGESTFEIWGRITGKDDTKNKYFLFENEEIDIFGNCVVLQKVGNSYVDFNTQQWESRNKIEEVKENFNDSDDDYNFNDEELKKDVYLYKSEEEEAEEEEAEEA